VRPIAPSKPAIDAATPRPVAGIVTDQLARETRDEVRVEILDVLHAFQHAAVDLVGVSEIARDVWRLGSRYRAHGRAIQSALDRSDLPTVVSELRAVLGILAEADGASRSAKPSVPTGDQGDSGTAAHSARTMVTR
jgi:hypothetical protein